MHLQRAEVGRLERKQQGLHFMRDGQLALQPLLFFLLVNQLGQRLGHGVERSLERGHLIASAYRDLVSEISPV